MTKLVPWWLWALLGVAIVGGVWFHYARWTDGFREEGRQEVRAEWDAEKEKVALEIERLRLEAGKITTVTEIRYVDRERVIYEKGDEIVRTVKVFVPDDSCELGGGFRVFHDAAVENRIPDPAEIITAAPVSAKEVASTVAENYAGCLANAAKVEEWQYWAEEQCKLNSNGCPNE